MKKALKMVVHLFSILSLGLVVFLGGAVVRFTDKEDSNGNGAKKLIPPLAFEFGAEHASADTPVGGGGGTSAGGDGDCEGGGGGGDEGGGDC